MIDTERGRLYVQTVLIVLLAPAVAYMLIRAYQPQSFLWEFLRTGSDLVAPAAASSIEFVSSILLGLYTGLLGLFTLDERKRIQGLLLSFGSIMGMGIMATSDILLPNIDFFDLYNVGGLILGGLAAISLGLPHLVEQIIEEKPQSRFELSFPYVSWGLFGFLSFVLVAGLTGTMVAGTVILPLDVPLTFGTMYVLSAFIKYTSQSDVVFIGPRESGKSLLLLGLYLSYRKRDIAGTAKGYMRELVAQADSMTPGDDFPIANTYDLEESWFFLMKGRLFPQRIKLSVTDHTEAMLRRLGDELDESPTFRDRITIWMAKYRQLNPLVTMTPGCESNYRLFERQVRATDVVVLCVDVARLQQGEFGFVDSLKRIGKRAQSNGASVLVVATKCDLLIDEFSLVVDNPLEQGLDRKFRLEIEQKLRDRYGIIDQMCIAVGAYRIYPVYYQTTKTKDGRLIPVVDSNGAPQYHGIDPVGDELLDEL